MLKWLQRNKKNTSFKSAATRKAENESYLSSLGIPYNTDLPAIEEESQARIRTASEVAGRIIILSYLIYKSESPKDGNRIIEFLKEFGLWTFVSEEEKKLFKKETLSTQEFINISWRTEAIWMLLWIAGKMEKIELPTYQQEITAIVPLLPEFFKDPRPYLDAATIRPVSQILDYSDLIYRIHWAVRDALLHRRPEPCRMERSVVAERHYAINWVTYYGEDWDDISTDT
ncbi:MAG: DUF4272 domain-containing protein [Saprospiraceae bacterium]|nr:DUF4272 domain-containing protein [Saprospiraceae bacterium]